MSIASMTNLAINRRLDVENFKAVTEEKTKDIERGKVSPAEFQGPQGATLASISAYIPTEVITLYIAALGALTAATQNKNPSKTDLWIFATFLLLTPLIVWLLYAGKVVTAKKTIPLSFRTWPKWEMVASTVSFFTWAAALPNSPMSPYIPQSLAAVLIVVVAGMLGFVAPLVQRPLSID